MKVGIIARRLVHTGAVAGHVPILAAVTLLDRPVGALLAVELVPLCLCGTGDVGAVRGRQPPPGELLRRHLPACRTVARVVVPEPGAIRPEILLEQLLPRLGKSLLVYSVDPSHALVEVRPAQAVLRLRRAGEPQRQAEPRRRRHLCHCFPLPDPVTAARWQSRNRLLSFKHPLFHEMSKYGC